MDESDFLDLLRRCSDRSISLNEFLKEEVLVFINEYGSIGDPTVIFLAPMMVSGSDLYNLMSPYFRGAYHVIAPDQGAHGKAGSYISADDEYQTLRSFLLESGCTDIALVYGASLGVAVGYRLFLDPAFHIAHAWFDGFAFAENAAFAEWFMKKMFRSRKKTLAKTHAEASENLVKMYGYDFAKMMTKNFERITLDDIDNICRACCHYELKKLSTEDQKKLHLDFGEKDVNWKYSRKTVPVYMPEAELKFRPGYGHCGYMAVEMKKYVEEIEAFMSGEN